MAQSGAAGWTKPIPFKMFRNQTAIAPIGRRTKPFLGIHYKSLKIGALARYNQPPMEAYSVKDQLCAEKGENSCPSLTTGFRACLRDNCRPNGKLLQARYYPRY